MRKFGQIPKKFFVKHVSKAYKATRNRIQATFFFILFCKESIKKPVSLGDEEAGEEEEEILYGKKKLIF